MARQSSIQRKIMVAIMATSITVLGISILTFTAHDLSSFRAELRRNLETLAGVIAESSTASVRFGDETDATKVLQTLHNEPQITAAAIYDGKGNILARYPTNATHLPEHPRPLGFEKNVRMIELFRPIMFNSSQIGSLYLQSNLKALYSRFILYGFIALLVVALSVLATTLMSRRMEKRISDPILALAETARAVSEKKDYSIRAKKLSEDEIGLLTDAFNLMLTRIEEQTVALHKSGERLQLALEAGNTGTWDWDITLNKMTWDEQTYRLFGLPPGTVIETYEQFLQLVHPEDQPLLSAAVVGAIEKKTDVVVDYRVIWKDGSVHNLTSRGKAFYDEAGRAVRLPGVTVDISQQKQAEQARAFLAAIVESSDDAILSMDLSARIVSWNKGAERLFGFSAAEAVGQHISIIVPPGLQEEEQKFFAQILRDEPVFYETVRLRKDGTPLDVSLTLSPIRDERGKIVGASKISRNITERKRAERALHESQIRKSAILESALDAIITMDEAGYIVEFNPAAEKLFGYKRKKVVGKLVAETIIPKPLRQADALGLKRFIETGEGPVLNKRIEMPALRADGTEFAAELAISPTRLESGQLFFTAYLRDITERKLAEERIQASLKEVSDLKAALDEHASVAITSPEGIITYVNDKFCAISKYSREELTGKDYRIINSGYHSKEFFRNLWTIIGLGRVWKGEIRNRTKDGAFFWVETTIVPFLNAKGVPMQYVAISADITERKEAEEKIRLLNEELEKRVQERTAELTAANRELEAFTYSVAHDLRAPLRHINAFAKILEEDFSAQLSEEVRQHLSRIRSSSHNLSHLVDDLLNLARVGRQELSYQPVDLNRLVDQARADLRVETEGRKIEWRIQQLPHLECDPGLMKVVFVNLLSNAVKYTRPRKLAIIEIGVVEENDEMIFFIRDNGVGFNMQYANKLFGVFQRLHRQEEFEGTGVGLATVDRIIRKHGGRIRGESEVDKGATFFFTIGLAEKPVRARQLQEVARAE